MADNPSYDLLFTCAKCYTLEHTRLHLQWKSLIIYAIKFYFLRKLLNLAPFNAKFVEARLHKKHMLNSHHAKKKFSSDWYTKKIQTKPCSEKQRLNKIILLSNEKFWCLSFRILKSASTPCIISLNNLLSLWRSISKQSYVCNSSVFLTAIWNA